MVSRLSFSSGSFDVKDDVDDSSVLLLLLHASTGLVLSVFVATFSVVLTSLVVFVTFSVTLATGILPSIDVYDSFLGAFVVSITFSVIVAAGVSVF